MEYARPKKLCLLTEERLAYLHQQDIERQDEYNREYDPDYNLDKYTRKWYTCMSDASRAWAKLQTLTEAEFYEVIHWLSVDDEPCNPNRGRPGKVKEVARDIKYAMSAKQRAVAYQIITTRYNNGKGYKVKK